MRDLPVNYLAICLRIFITRLFFFTILSSLFTATSLAQRSNFAPSNSKVGTSTQALSAQETQPSEVRELKVGQPIERELAGGESHSYRVALTAGRYLHVVVEQKGVDVVVRLFGPDGKQITEVDSPNGTQGPELVSAIAEVSGEFRLEVKSLEEKAAPGRYEVRVEELREATSKDRDRIAAERALAEAQQFRSQETGESLRKTLEKYQEALTLLRKLENRQEEARTLMRIGTVYWLLGDSQKALEFSNQALPVWRAIGDQAGEATTLHNLGVDYWELGDNWKALEFLNQALPLQRAVGDREEEAKTLGVIGLAYDYLGKPQEAIEYLNQALAIHRSIGNRKGEATTLFNIGLTHHGVSEWQKALEYYNQSLSLAHSIGNRRLEATIFVGIGTIYWQLDENQKALDYYNQALPLTRATGDRIGESNTLHNIGRAYQSLNESQKALEYYNQALSLLRTTGNRRGEAATLHNIGTLYKSLGDSSKALDFLNQALTLRRAVGDRLGEAITLSWIGENYFYSGKTEEALSYLEQALSLLRAIGDRISEAATLQQIARAERGRGRLAVAKTQIETALTIVERMRSMFVSQELRTSFSASRQEFYEFYIDLLMQMHRRQPSAGYDSAALHASERARARSLLDLLTESRADIRQGVDPLLVDRERSLQQQLNASSERLTRLLSSKHNEEQEAAARKRVELILTDYEDVQTQIRAKSPRYAALTQPQPLAATEIQSQILDQDTLLLEYSIGEERSYVWAVTPTSIKSFELPKRAVIENLARRLYDDLTARNKLVRFENSENKRVRIAQADADYAKASEQLSEVVLGPVAAQLDRKRLLIVSEGALQYIPFGALPIPLLRRSNGSKPKEPLPLIVNHEIVNLPSASALAVWRTEVAGRERGSKTIAVLADPVFRNDDPRIKRAVKASNEPGAMSNTISPSVAVENSLERSARDVGELEFPRLPHSREEAEAILAFARPAMRRKALDFEANRTAATSADLSNYRFVHFATHGFLDSQHPELSGIVLSLVDEQGIPQNGFLRLNEIYNLKLNADLVVLSACRTALGREIKGEGLVGVTRGFMYAGAPRVVASLWAVDDQMTAELMTRFYREMLIKMQRPAAALRTAQVSIWNEKRLPPYYWAAFVLQGEWK